MKIEFSCSIYPGGGEKVVLKCKQCDYMKRKFATLQIFNRVLQAVVEEARKISKKLKSFRGKLITRELG